MKLFSIFRDQILLDLVKRILILSYLYITREQIQDFLISDTEDRI